MHSTGRSITRTATVLLLVVLLSACSSGPPVGKQTPSFKATDLVGNTVSSKTTRDTVTLLYFWATWCPPCATSGPAVEQLQKKYADNGGVKIIGVHYNTSALVTDYVREHGYTFTIIPDGSRMAKEFHVTKIPSFILIDREGTVVLNQVGFAPEDVEKFAALIDRQLEKR